MGKNLEEDDGHIEYFFKIEDKLIKKVWNFSTRYANLREFYINLLEGKKMKHYNNKKTNNFASFLCNSDNINENSCFLPPPKFPNKSFFKKKDKEFLDKRLMNLKEFFKNLIFNSIYKEFLDAGNLKQFFFQEIWIVMEKNIKHKFYTIKDWNKLMINANKLKQFNNEDQRDLRILIDSVRIEADKLDNKFDEIVKNMKILEQNDTLMIMHYEEKRRKEIENEMNK